MSKKKMMIQKEKNKKEATREPPEPFIRAMVYEVALRPRFLQDALTSRQKILVLS